ncbi:MAG: DUF72 domain-containing protein [Chitinophagaceae bacterium]
MKFGNVLESQLSEIDFSLPGDHSLTQKVLGGTQTVHPKVYVGSGNWGHASWNGNTYPTGTPAKKFRELYPLYFNTIELNATHYTIYKEEVLRSWCPSALGRDFKFCPKFPQSISHFSSFSGVDAQTDAFLKSVHAFGENLGPLFLQVSDQFSPIKKDVLFGYLSALPNDLDVFLELRHEQWFKDDLSWIQTLIDIQKGLVITDTPGRRDCVHMYLTIPKLFLRFVCNQNHPTTYNRINEWAVRIAAWMQQGLKEVYIFLHPGDEVYIPELVSAFITAINKETGLSIKLPFPKQASLF